MPAARSAVLDARVDARLAGGGASGVVSCSTSSPSWIPALCIVVLAGVPVTRACSVSARSTAGDRRRQEGRPGGIAGLGRASYRLRTTMDDHCRLRFDVVPADRFVRPVDIPGPRFASCCWRDRAPVPETRAQPQGFSRSRNTAHLDETAAPGSRSTGCRPRTTHVQNVSERDMRAGEPSGHVCSVLNAWNDRLLDHFCLPCAVSAAARFLTSRDGGS